MITSCLHKILEGKWSNISFIRQGIKDAKRGNLVVISCQCNSVDHATVVPHQNDIEDFFEFGFDFYVKSSIGV